MARSLLRPITKYTLIALVGMMLGRELGATTITGALHKTYADRPNTPAAGFNVKVCSNTWGCVGGGLTDSTGYFSFYASPLMPDYYYFYAWNDAQLWGSESVSEYQPTFYVGTIPDLGGTILLGNLVTSPRPLVPQAIKPVDGGAAFPRPCTTMFSWTDGLDSMRRLARWPVNYQMTLVTPYGWATTYNVNTPSLSLNLPIAGGSYLWYVVARLGVAQSPPGNWIYLETRSPNFSLWVPYSAGDCSTPIDDAQFVSQTPPPSTLQPGEQRSVSVTMKNTGTSTWTEAGGYFRLGSQNPQDNAIWGLGRVFLAPGESITPGQQKTFTFNITAPSAPEIYNFQWRMVHEMIRWFGDYTPNATVSVSGLDSQPPVVTWISPANGSTLSGVVTLAVNATDNVRVSKVEMYANGYRLTPTYSDCSLIPGATAILNPPYQLCVDTSNGSVDGTYTLTAKAYDDAGNVGVSAPITITVANPKLALSINRTFFHTTDRDWTITIHSSLVGSSVTLIEEFWNGSYWQEDWRGGIGQIPSTGTLTFVDGAPYFAGSFRSHVESAGFASNYVSYSVSP